MLASVLFWVLIIFFIVWLSRNQQGNMKFFFAGGLTIKILTGIGVGLIYKYYYSTGDTFGFYNDAKVLVGFFDTSPGEYFNFILIGDRSFALAENLLNVEMRSLFFVKNLSIITILSFRNYWIASVFFSMISFLGCWYIVKKICAYFPHGKSAALVSFLFIPSFVFWSSGIIKESLALAALAFLAGFTLLIIHKGNIRLWEWVVAVLASVFLWKLKYYWAALFIPAAITTILLIRVIVPVMNANDKLYELLVWFVIFGFIVWGASNLHPNFYMSRFLNVVVENHNAYVLASDSAPVVHFNNLEATWMSVLQNSPWALFSGLFRPFVTEGKTVFQIIVAVENLLLLVLCFLNARFFSSMVYSRQHLLVVSVVTYICLLTIFLTLSTPNFGTLSRYRIGFLPFLSVLLLYYPSQHIIDKISNKLKNQTGSDV